MCPRIQTPPVRLRYCLSAGSVPTGAGPNEAKPMKTPRFLITIALVAFGCTPVAQNTPPPVANATPRPPAVAAETPASVAGAPAPLVSEGRVPSSPSKATAASPVDAKPASPGSGSSAGATTASAPIAERSTPHPVAPPTRVRLIIPSGTLLPIEIQTTASSASSKQGDPVLAVLTADVALAGFKLDKGAEVRGHVRTAIPAKRVKGQARLVVAFDAVMEKGEKLSITTEAIDNMAASTRGKDKKIIAGGAAAGLILGAIKDGGKGAAVGTVIGAAAGTGAVLIIKGAEVELPRGARLTVVVTK